MNTDDYYTESDIKLLFGNARKSRGLRNKVRITKISNRILYFREDVNKILESKYNTEKRRAFLEIALSKIENHNIDLDMWIPLGDALKILKLTRERLYQISTVRDGKKVHAIKFNGFWMFNKDDLEKL